MRTKFTVKYKTTYKYTCEHIDPETKEPWHKTGDTEFTSNFYYLGEDIGDCLRAFWTFVCRHGYNMKHEKDERSYDTYVTIVEVTSTMVDDDYCCGNCDSAGGLKFVCTQIISDMVFMLWSKSHHKVTWINCDEPRKMPDECGHRMKHYGKGMENLQIGDIVELTTDIHSLIDSGCRYYNLTGERDIELAKEMYQYAIHEENNNPYKRPGDFTECYFPFLKRKGVEPVVISALDINE